MNEIATLEGSSVEPAGGLLAFASRLRWRCVRNAAAAAAARTLVVAGGPWILGAWCLPGWRLPSGLAVVGLVLTAAGLGAARARRTGDAALLRGERGLASQDAMRLVGDELATWLEVRRQTAADVPMVGWLGRDVQARLPGLPAAAIAGVGRIGLGRWRRLVPVVLLLLMVWLLAEWLAPPWPGVLGGGSSATGPGSGGSGAGSGGGSGAGAGREPAPDQPPDVPPDASPDASSPPPPNAPPPPPEGAEEPPPEPEAPAPLLELPEQQRFVVPDFVGDGPTRRARMHAAEVDRAGAAPRPANAPSGGSGDAPAAPPPSREAFDRAAEAALRARHVPPEERAMVRRFFELLREAAR